MYMLKVKYINIVHIVKMSYLLWDREEVIGKCPMIKYNNYFRMERIIHIYFHIFLNLNFIFLLVGSIYTYSVEFHIHSASAKHFVGL
jgi:hypothetical protein